MDFNSILVSWPEISLRILGKCLAHISTEISIKNSVICGVVSHQAAKGADIAPNKAASDEKRNKIAVNNHIEIAISPVCQDKVRIIPIAVATPLPPLNLSHTGNRCPKNAPNPATIAMSGPNSVPMREAITPFRMSAISVAAAAPFFPVRKTFVAPIFPEPMLRISPRPNNFAKINPNGTEPIEYPPIKAVSMYGQENDQLIGSIMSYSFGLLLRFF